MPTRQDFEAAAETFFAAAEQVATLTTAVDALDVAGIVRGGSLGSQVPGRIASASATAATCRVLIENAASTCLERAAVIADYELQLDGYDRAFASYVWSKQRWSSRHRLWRLDPDVRRHPGWPPRPPTPPVGPPGWADVRRP